MGKPDRLAIGRHPQAIAVALAFRHSWQREEPDHFSKRLGVTVTSEDLADSTHTPAPESKTPESSPERPRKTASRAYRSALHLPPTETLVGGAVETFTDMHASSPTGHHGLDSRARLVVVKALATLDLASGGAPALTSDSVEPSKGNYMMPGNMWHERGAGVMKPLATLVLGGMVSSLLHVLVVTPVRMLRWRRQSRLARSAARQIGRARHVGLEDPPPDHSPVSRTRR